MSVQEEIKKYKLVLLDASTPEKIKRKARKIRFHTIPLRNAVSMASWFYFALLELMTINGWNIWKQPVGEKADQESSLSRRRTVHGHGHRQRGEDQDRGVRRAERDVHVAAGVCERERVLPAIDRIVGEQDDASLAAQPARHVDGAIDARAVDAPLQRHGRRVHAHPSRELAVRSHDDNGWTARRRGRAPGAPGTR